jgi:acetylornithine aminotransferase/4-aminobutyrate aminotransferase
MNMVLTTSAMIYRQRISTTNNILMAPFPHELHGQQYTTESCLKELEMMLEMQTLPEEVAAIIVEPVNRESGYVPASREFMKGLRKICNKHGIVFIVDEVNTGFGRTGELFASNYHHEGSPPDILVLSKGFASGFPLSAIVTSEAISRHFQDADTLAGGMYSGSAVSYAAALATQQVIQEENLVENAKIQGERLWNGLMEIQKNHPSIIRDVRGPGCMIGVELQPKAVPGTNKVLCFQSYEKGLLILPASSAFPTVKFIPPLSVKEKEIDKALDIFERTLTEFE